MRHCFKSTDGHNYLIPNDMSEQFDYLEEQGYDDDWTEFNNTFDEYRCDSVQNWTFTDPKEDA